MKYIYYNLLSEIPPLPEEEWLNQEYIDTDSEINQLQEEISSVATDSIPFDKYDAIIVFAAAISEIALDFFLSDPKNPDSFAYKCNHNDNPMGQWMNSIHEKVDHKGHPIDFQGRFNVDGNSILNGIKHDENVISFGGGNHRSRTFGHDLLYFVSAIKQLHDGKFDDKGFIDGKCIEVVTESNQYDNLYEKLDWLEAIWEYCRHMFADFFSSKGLPAPGWSFLSHHDNREIRKLADNLYKDGVNLRTELLKSVTVMGPEIAIRLIMHFRYKDSDYSEEAKKQKLHLLLLLTHGIATAVNIGKVVITKNPASVNLPMIIRTITLVFSCMKDQINFNQRVLTKISLSDYKTKLELKQTMIIVLNGLYYTFNYQTLISRAKNEYDKRLKVRFDKAVNLSNLNLDYQYWKFRQQEELEKNDPNILYLVNLLGDNNIDNCSLSSLVNQVSPSDENANIDSISELMKKMSAN